MAVQIERKILPQIRAQKVSVLSQTGHVIILVAEPCKDGYWKVNPELSNVNGTAKDVYSPIRVDDVTSIRPSTK